MATTKGLFVLGATLAGLAFGMVWPLVVSSFYSNHSWFWSTWQFPSNPHNICVFPFQVLITGEVFGTANVGANYMFFDGFTSAAGSLLLSKFIAQEVYESHIDRHDDPDNVTCLGSGCFSMTHAVCAALSAVCIFTSLCTMATTRKIYNQARFHKS